MANEPATAAARPPYSNRGVTIPVDVACGGDDRSVFDAYCATVYAHPLLILDHLEQGLLDAGFEPQRQDGPPVRFYANNTLLVDGEGTRLLQVRHGGQNGNPFVEAKGAVSPVVAATLRQHFEHSPARVDSAHDLSGPDVFQQLRSLAHRYEAKGLKIDYAGAAHDHPDRGTTIYLGSRKSQAFVRIYQKGLKHAEEMGLAPHEIPDELRNWVRVELECKPDKKPARERVAALSPDALWGVSPWTALFANEALLIDAKRVQMNERKESNQDRAMRFLVTQYGPTILRQVERLGSWERFADDLQERLGLLETTH